MRCAPFPPASKEEFLTIGNYQFNVYSYQEDQRGIIESIYNLPPMPRRNGIDAENITINAQASIEEWEKCKILAEKLFAPQQVPE